MAITKPISFQNQVAETYTSSALYMYRFLLGTVSMTGFMEKNMDV